MTEHILSVNGLTKRYGDKTVVKGISFHVREGEIFGILGPNGAGKTTTLEMIETISMIAVILVTAAAVLIFNLEIRGDYLLLAGFLLLSAILLTGFGLFVGALAINEDQAAIGAITLSVILFGTLSLPRWVLPDWLQALTDYLPITPVMDGIRAIVVEGISLGDLSPQLAVIGVWTAVIYAVSIRVFRWE